MLLDSHEVVLACMKYFAHLNALVLMLLSHYLFSLNLSLESVYVSCLVVFTYLSLLDELVASI